MLGVHASATPGAMWNHGSMRCLSGGLDTVHSEVWTQSFKAHFCFVYKAPTNGTLQNSGQNTDSQGKEPGKQNLGDGSWREEYANCGDRDHSRYMCPTQGPPRVWWPLLFNPTNIESKKTKSKSHKSKMPFYAKCTPHTFYITALSSIAGKDTLAYLSLDRVFYQDMI